MKNILIILFFIPLMIFADCMSDSDCDSGNYCFKATQSQSMEGTCVKLNATAILPLKTGPHETMGCQFDTDCQPGNTCQKPDDGSLYGVCVNN